MGYRHFLALFCVFYKKLFRSRTAIGDPSANSLKIVKENMHTMPVCHRCNIVPYCRPNCKVA